MKKHSSLFFRVLATVILVSCLLSATFTVSAGAQHYQGDIDKCEFAKEVIRYNSDGTPLDKEVYEYDNRGNTLSVISYDYNTQKGEYVNSHKEEYTYNEANFITEQILSDWDNNSENWVKYYFEATEYDDKNREIKYEYFYFSQDGEITSAEKRESTFNDHDDVIRNTFYTWDSIAEELKISSIYSCEFTYDELGRVTEYSYSSADAQTEPVVFVKHGRDVTTYEGKTSTELDYYYYSNVEYLGSKHEKTFDDEDRVLEYTYSTYNEYTGQFEYYSRDRYEYNNNGNTVLYVYYQYDDVEEEWKENYREEYKYDQNNNLLSETYYSGSTKVGETIYEYDQEGRNTLRIFKTNFGQELVNVSKTETSYEGNFKTDKNYNWQGNEWSYCGCSVAEIEIIHTLYKVDGQAATTENSGFKDFYMCMRCGKFFEDSEGKVEIADITKWKAEGGSGFLPKLSKVPTSPQTGVNTTPMNIALAVFSLGVCTSLFARKKNKAK